VTLDNAVHWKLSGFGDEVDTDPHVQGAVLLALGAHHIEVRSAWGINVVELDDEATVRLKAGLDALGLTVSAVASPIGKVDVSLPVEYEVERLLRVIRVAKTLGTRFIRIFSFFRSDGQSADDVRDAVIERMTRLAATAAEHDVVLLHENEKGIYGDTPERVLDLVVSVGSPHLRLAWDSANFVQVGVKPFTDAYAMLRPYVDYLQVKDAIAASGDGVLHLQVPAGRGDGELLETLTALRDDGYTGFASLEPHLASAHELGGFSGPEAFGDAGRAFRQLTDSIGVNLV
jgi:sugar phosphate isomerase/epimerase